MDWCSIGTRLAKDCLSWPALDWQWIDNGLATDWQRIGIGLATDWHSIGDGLVLYWYSIGEGLSELAGSGLAMD